MLQNAQLIESRISYKKKVGTTLYNIIYAYKAKLHNEGFIDFRFATNIISKLITTNFNIIHIHIIHPTCSYRIFFKYWSCQVFWVDHGMPFDILSTYVLRRHEVFSEYLRCFYWMYTIQTQINGAFQWRFSRHE